LAPQLPEPLAGFFVVFAGAGAAAWVWAGVAALVGAAAGVVGAGVTSAADSVGVGVLETAAAVGTETAGACWAGPQPATRRTTAAPDTVTAQMRDRIDMEMEST
jgi:hypothetical protein